MITTTTEQIALSFRGKTVRAYKLTISSEIALNIDAAWELVKTSGLLCFVSREMVSFRPLGGRFPKAWQENETVRTKMSIYGIVPFGGVHSIYFEKIDDMGRVMQTRERDCFARVWDHRISMEEVAVGHIRYRDEVVIYAGIFSRPVAYWARAFYIHRQKRWRLLARVT